MELFKSVCYFLWGIVKRIYIWIALLLDPFDLYQRFIPLVLQEKYKVYIDMVTPWGLILFILAIFWAAIMTYHEVRINIMPRLEVSFKKGEKTYFEEMICSDIRYPGKTPFAALNQTYRICVRNISNQSINNVEVRLKSITPHPQNVYKLPLPLRFMTDEPPFKFSKTITPEQEEFIDVVSYPKGTDTRYKICIEHIHKDIPHIIEPREYEIEIKITGDTTTSITKKYKIYVKEGTLHMESLDKS